MAVICICGVCIPYSSLIPLVLIIFRPLWTYIRSVFGWDKKDNKHTEKTCCSAAETAETDSYFQEKNAIDFKPEYEWDKLIGSDKITIVRFTASWCKPCKRVEPVFYELANIHKSHRFVTVDVDDNDELYQSLGIVGIPHIRIYKEGNVLHSISGENKTEIESMINDCCS
mmetsp:Transcript_7167/g.10660  ORF Transcript_7167/g.10660 Transcript_7167/m.10660 type:complete len:170 (-) Transcript_7167:208-717(-)|eukprot:CAMPEP_0185020858 /NCGR_PEP_ID=MMETSP1103-20130426/3507_1 /TAXON_ID=36769 /ORGANISM="Paraphysomonas bandaiensis, Strain Caron Lab Isolate" /LENGTH=169 /DNA_ID=CAMNT_0027552021 /DNA_START=70 /DNA_END=579 /DNA_ORIENTATION=-